MIVQKPKSENPSDWIDWRVVALETVVNIDRQNRHEILKEWEIANQYLPPLFKLKNKTYTVITGTEFEDNLIPSEVPKRFIDTVEVQRGIDRTHEGKLQGACRAYHVYEINMSPAN